MSDKHIVIDESGVWVYPKTVPPFVTPAKRKPITQSADSVRAYLESLPDYLKLSERINEIMGSTAQFRTSNVDGNIRITAMPQKSINPMILIDLDNKTIEIQTLIPERDQMALLGLAPKEDEAKLAELIKSRLLVHKIEKSDGSVYYQFGPGPNGWRLNIFREHIMNADGTTASETAAGLVNIQTFSNLRQVNNYINHLKDLTAAQKKELIAGIKSIQSPTGKYTLRTNTSGDIAFSVAAVMNGHSGTATISFHKKYGQLSYTFQWAVLPDDVVKELQKKMP